MKAINGMVSRTTDWRQFEVINPKDPKFEGFVAWGRYVRRAGYDRDCTCDPVIEINPRDVKRALRMGVGPQKNASHKYICFCFVRPIE